MLNEVQNATAPAGAAARLDRADRLSFAITTLIALTVYLFTLAPEVTLTFAGVLTTAAMYQGFAHPPGFSAWTLYSWLFIKLLPFSNPAWRVAVASAVAGAAACGLVALIVSHIGRTLGTSLSSLSRVAPKLLSEGGSTPLQHFNISTLQRPHMAHIFERFTAREQMLTRIVCGTVAGLALAFSGGFWQQAVIQDWWTFSALLFALVLYMLTRWIVAGRRCFCCLAFFAYGLLLTNNQELMLGLPGLALAVTVLDPKLGRDVSICVLPLGAAVSLVTGFPLLAGPWRSRPMLESFAIGLLVAFAIVIATRRIGSEWKSALACTLFFSLGLAVYLYVPIASMTNPPMNWGYPRTVEGFFHVISRGQYELVNPTSDLARFKMQLWALLTMNGRELGWIYLIFAALPFALLWRLNPIGRKATVSLLPMFVCVGPLLLTLLNPDNDRLSWNDIFEPYFFPLRVLLDLWAGVGLILFATTISKSG